MPTLVAELGVPLWATGQALESHCSSRGAEKPPFPRKIEIWRDIGGGSHYFRWPQSYPITRPPPPSSLVQKKPRPDQVTFSVFAPNLTHRRAALSRAISERRSRGVTFFPSSEEEIQPEIGGRKSPYWSSAVSFFHPLPSHCCFICDLRAYEAPVFWSAQQLRPRWQSRPRFERAAFGCGIESRKAHALAERRGSRGARVCEMRQQTTDDT